MHSLLHYECIIIHLSFHKGAGVGLEKSEYTIKEGDGSVDVCVISSAELDRTVFFVVTTENGTAEEGNPHMLILSLHVCIVTHSMYY